MHKLADLVGEPIEDANLVSTLSGWFVHRLGRFPLIGDELILQHGILRVEAIVGTKVARIRLEKSVERASAAA